MLGMSMTSSVRLIIKLGYFIKYLCPACTLHAKIKTIVSFGCSGAQIGYHIGVPETILHGFFYTH